MKAIRVHEFGGPEVLKLEEVPTPSSPSRNIRFSSQPLEFAWNFPPRPNSRTSVRWLVLRIIAARELCPWSPQGCIRRQLHAVAKRHGWSVVQVFEDAGISGPRVARTGRRWTHCSSQWRAAK
jgi:hypothetical protein